MSTLRDSIDRLARWAIRAVLVLQVGCLSAWWLARKIQHGTHPRIEAVPAEVLGMSCSHRQTCKSVGRLRGVCQGVKGVCRARIMLLVLVVLPVADYCEVPLPE